MPDTRLTLAECFAFMSAALGQVNIGNAVSFSPGSVRTMEIVDLETSDTIATQGIAIAIEGIADPLILDADQSQLCVNEMSAMAEAARRMQQRLATQQAMASGILGNKKGQ